MHSRRNLRTTIFFFLALTLSFALAGAQVIITVYASGNPAAPQKSKNKSSKDKSSKDKKSKATSSAPQQSGTPALWESRGDISKLNLVYGIGSPEGMPKPPFQFDKEDITGTNPKIKVMDANGVKWNI